MRRLKLVIEYDGTDFHGWQVQPSVRTVQGELQRALRVMTGEEIKVRGASRTDAGVHALGQVAHFSTNSTIRAAQFGKGLTALTGADLSVREVTEVPIDFSARHDARGKTYRYTIWNAAEPSPLRRRTAWHVRGRLEAEAIRTAASFLVGEHDFAAFRAASCDQPTTVRAITHLEVSGTSPGTFEVAVEGTAFLQHMVRIIVGTLVDVGRGRLVPDRVKEILESRDRREAGQTAPAHGLCLVAVHY